jgi:hypothetical protein
MPIAASTLHGLAANSLTTIGDPVYATPRDGWHTVTQHYLAAVAASGLAALIRANLLPGTPHPDHEALFLHDLPPPECEGEDLWKLTAVYRGTLYPDLTFYSVRDGGVMRERTDSTSPNTPDGYPYSYAGGSLFRKVKTDVTRVVTYLTTTEPDLSKVGDTFSTVSGTYNVLEVMGYPKFPRVPDAEVGGVSLQAYPAGWTLSTREADHVMDSTGISKVWMVTDNWTHRNQTD